jgi:hypothetical protein
MRRKCRARHSAAHQRQRRQRHQVGQYGPRSSGFATLTAFPSGLRAWSPTTCKSPVSFAKMSSDCKMPRPGLM